MSGLSRRSASLLATIALIVGWAGAQGDDGHGHGHGEPLTDGPEPVLSVGDFDGSGEVTEEDVLLVEEWVASNDYVAFFDRNADGTLDEADVEATRSEVGEDSEPVDQELAMLFHNTKQYRDQDRAIEAGFIPLTGAFAGHGIHWAKHPNSGGVGYAFQPAHPVGLNYDEDGELWGVFYYLGPSPSRGDGTAYPPRDDFRPLMDAPEGFTGDRDPWHFHAGACFDGLSYEDPSLNPEDLTFREGVSPSECLPEIEGFGEEVFVSGDVRWAPKFHMLHAWVFELNPHGTFAGTHPDLAPDAPPEVTAAPNGRVDTLDEHPDYPFRGGQLCAWFADVNLQMALEHCQQEGAGAGSG